MRLCQEDFLEIKKKNKMVMEAVKVERKVIVTMY